MHRENVLTERSVGTTETSENVDFRIVYFQNWQFFKNQ